MRLFGGSRSAELKTCLLLQIVSVEFAEAAQLNYYGAVLRRHEVWDAGGDDNKTAHAVALQLSRVEPFTLAQVPGSFDNSNQFVVRVCMRQDAPATGYL